MLIASPIGFYMLLLDVGQEKNVLSGQLEREETASYPSPVKAWMRVAAGTEDGIDFVCDVEV